MNSFFNGRSGKWARRLTLLLLDSLLTFCSLEIAIYMRYETHISAGTYANIMRHVPAMLLIYFACSYIGGTYSMMWRYAGTKETIQQGFIYVAAVIANLLMNHFGRWHISRPVLVMTGVCAMLLVLASRFAWKWIFERRHARGKHKSDRRLLIVGAGQGGVYAADICKQNPAKFGMPVAFVDDDPMKRHLTIHGVSVCGSLSDIEKVVEKKEVNEIIVAIPTVKGEKLAQIISVCKNTKCRIRILSDPDEIGNGKNMTIRELDTSDFLSREEVKLDTDMIRGYLTDKTILVTGGGGSIGSEICRQIMRFHPKLLLIFDVYENCAYELECELKQKYGADVPIKVLIGSIRDKTRLDDVFETYKPSVVFHAAAHKHVPLMEVSPAEAIKNNVFGTRNLLQSASEHKVERFVQLSTDKAVNPTNVMGATKRICEMLLQNYARHTEMKCMAVRFGNVLGSHGSVIPLFEAQIRKGGPVTLTHPDITRYFMTIPEAAQLVLQAGGLAQSGAIYVLDMGEPVRLMDLAEKLIRFYGYEPNVDIPIKIIGLRPGEKLYEELLMDSERDHMTHTAHNKIFVAPPIPIEEEVFENLLGQIKIAAAENDEPKVVELLVDIVGTYKPNRDMLAS